MPESIRPEKNILAFNQGLNTESPEIAFPDGFTTDERNYELLLDGSRRRRKGLQEESGGATYDTTNRNVNGYCQSYKWTNVGGDPDKSFYAHRLGRYLYFSDDAETISTAFHSDYVDLATAYIGGTTANEPCQFADGRGVLLVTNPTTRPLFIEYDSAADSFSVSSVDIRIRDYQDQDTTTSVTTQPTTLTDDFKTDLVNRGWQTADITQYYNDIGTYPSKNMRWHEGLKRTYDGSTAASLINPDDGVVSWDSTKLAAERFGSTTAPKGSNVVSIYSPQFALDESDGITVTSASASVAGGNVTVRLNVAAAHGVVGTDTIYVGPGTVYAFVTGAGYQYLDYSGEQTVTAVLDSGSFWVEFELGTVGIVSTTTVTYSYFGVNSLPRSTGTAPTRGSRACAWHDGRAFYAGTNQGEFSDFIFFSQIPDTTDKLKKCYQEANPTHSENNQMVDTDGGYIGLQGLEGAIAMRSMRNSLLIFGSNGVWEISGGQRGFFTPSGYSVRKLTEFGCSSPLSPIVIGSTCLYTGPAGIFAISPNQYTGILEAQSVSLQTIQSKWNAIAEAEQKLIMSVYDDAKNVVQFLYGQSVVGGAASTSYYDKALMWNLNLGAWSYYEWNSGTYEGIKSVFAITKTDGTDQKNKIKYIVAEGNYSVKVADHDSTTYLDSDGAESPLPYAVTGWDNLGDFQRRRQAPIVTVYSKRTETGYTDTGTGWSGDNESSTKMSAYWDWTEKDNLSADVSGKIGDQQQIYRHTRAFTPASAASTDGYPVVVTRNKVRGRGRVLQLRFDGEATKDSHIMGFTVNYRAQRAV